MSEKTKSFIKEREGREGFLAVLPLVCLVLSITAYPVGTAMYHSFTEWDGVNSVFLGFGNYLDIMKDSQFWDLLLNNLIYILSVPVQLIVSLFITVLLYERIPGWKAYRALFFLPNILSPIVIGLIFRQAFMYDGPINAFFKAVNLDFFVTDWLSNRASALAVIQVSVVWTNFGYGVVLMLAGLSTVSPSVFEAAELDGVNWFQKTFRIVFPVLSRMIEFFIVTTIIWTFTGLFGYIFSITNGGPGYDTTPLEYMIYIKAFRSGNHLGYACALAVILLLFTFAISRVQMAVSDRMSEGME